MTILRKLTVAGRRRSHGRWSGRVDAVFARVLARVIVVVVVVDGGG